MVDTKTACATAMVLPVHEQRWDDAVEKIVTPADRHQMAASETP